MLKIKQKKPPEVFDILKAIYAIGSEWTNTMSPFSIIQKEIW